MKKYIAAALVAIALAGCVQTRSGSDDPSFPTAEHWWE